MSKIKDDKHKQINDIVSVVKLASLLFLGIILFKYFFEGSSSGRENFKVYSYFFMLISMLIFLFIYIIWLFSAINKISAKYIKFVHLIENIIFISLFFIVMLMSGANTSEYKLLFLFIITTATIQSGMKEGITIACISSVLILTMDLVYGSSGTDINHYFENDLILAGIFILTAWPLGFYVKVESEHIRKLESLVNEDGLTGVYNHRFFHDALREKIIQCKNGNSVSLIFLDIDYFKHYNDLYGHQGGDEVLKTMGALLKDNVRQQDIVARYGGEEFAIILSNTSEEEATIIAEGIRYKVESTYFKGEENQPKGNLTVSIGISVYPEKARNDIELIKSADDALYRAKFFNKNRVETYTSILDELKHNIDEKDVELITSIKTLISVINIKDRYTYGHCERMVVYSRLLADRLGLSEEDKKKLVYGTYMHDIGKIDISKEVLNKKMPLTNEEWEILKQHPLNGVEIIKPVKSLKDIEPLILHHHERYDGKGYPDNLKGEDIPFLARVLTVIDSFDAMTSNRPYNKRKTYEEAIKELKICSGIQFDPIVADAFIEVIIEYKDKFDRLNYLG